MIIYNFLQNRKLRDYGFFRLGSGNVVTEPVTLSQAKEHLRIESSFTTDDTYITTLISVARSICENYVGFLLSNNDTVVYYLDQFPNNEVIDLYGLSKIDASSTAVKYYDSNDSLQTFPTSRYEVDEESIPSRLFLKSNASWPTTSDSRPSAIFIECEAGYTYDFLPKAIYQAILLTIGHLYENRQNVVIGAGKPYDVPQTAEHLLNTYRVVSI